VLIQDSQGNYQINEKNFINKICNFLNNFVDQFNKTNLKYHFKIARKKNMSNLIRQFYHKDNYLNNYFQFLCNENSK